VSVKQLKTELLAVMKDLKRLYQEIDKTTKRVEKLKNRSSRRKIRQ